MSTATYDVVAVGNAIIDVLKSVPDAFLAEENISEIRRFLRQIKGVETATINLVLRQRKEYPMLPVDPLMEPALDRIGLVRSQDSRDQKGKFLHDLFEGPQGLSIHHFFMTHARETCPPDETEVQCVHCSIRASCQFYETRSRGRGSSAKGSKASKKKPTTKKKTTKKKSAPGAKKASAAKSKTTKKRKSTRK